MEPRNDLFVVRRSEKEILPREVDLDLTNLFDNTPVTNVVLSEVNQVSTPFL